MVEVDPDFNRNPYSVDAEYAQYNPVPDAIVPAEGNVVSVRPPRLYVQQQCIDRCRSIRQVAADALLKNALKPDFQIDVICHGKTLFGCSAGTINTGQYSRFGSDEVFLQNPALFSGGTYRTVAEALQQASEAGVTPHDISELK